MKLFRCSHADQVEALERDLGAARQRIEDLEAKVKDLDAETITQHTVERLWARQEERRKKELERRREEEKAMEGAVYLPAL